MAHLMENPVRWRMDHPVCIVAGDGARHTGVRHGRAFRDNPSQVMAPHGFNDRIAVKSCRKSRPQGSDKGRHLPAGSQIFLGNHRINEGNQPESMACPVIGR